MTMERMMNLAFSIVFGTLSAITVLVAFAGVTHHLLFTLPLAAISYATYQEAKRCKTSR